MTTQMRAFEGGVTKAVADRQVRAIVSTPRTDRAGDVVEVTGIDLTEYRKNPVVLFAHDHGDPVARCAEIDVVDGALQALVQFPPEGTSRQADEVYGLIKAGVINATSVGFMPKEWSYLDDKAPWGGRRYASVELVEFSFVSVPANPDALVIERSLTGAEQIALARANLATIKAGRVLSVANETKLAGAHDAIGEVLSQVRGEDPAKAAPDPVLDPVLEAGEGDMPCEGCAAPAVCAKGGCYRRAAGEAAGKSAPSADAVSREAEIRAMEIRLFEIAAGL
jgi:HK97 family phage prohead protease